MTLLTIRRAEDLRPGWGLLGQHRCGDGRVTAYSARRRTAGAGRGEFGGAFREASRQPGGRATSISADLIFPICLKGLALAVGKHSSGIGRRPVQRTFLFSVFSLAGARRSGGVKGGRLAGTRVQSALDIRSDASTWLVLLRLRGARRAG